MSVPGLEVRSEMVKIESRFCVLPPGAVGKMASSDLASLFSFPPLEVRLCTQIACSLSTLVAGMRLLIETSPVTSEAWDCRSYWKYYVMNS